MAKSGYKFEIKTARIARSGIYKYPKEFVERLCGQAINTTDAYVNVYRPSLVLLDAVDKFKSVPLTYEHPKEGVVTPATYEKLSVGAVMDSPIVSFADGEVAIDNRIMLGSMKAYNALAMGIKELSPGYTASYEAKSGEYKGQHYDAVLTGIDSVNHLAITKRARGGHATRILDSTGELKLKTGLFHRIFRRTNDSKSFDELIDSIADGKETCDSVSEYVKTLPDSDKKSLLSRYIDDLGAGVGVFDEKLITDSADEIKKLYHELETEVDSETKDSEEEKEEPKEEIKEEAKEEVADTEKTPSEEQKEEAKEEEKKEDTADSEELAEEKPEENKETADSDIEEAETKGLTVDSLTEEEKKGWKELIITTILDSLSEEDSEIIKKIFSRKEQPKEFKRFSAKIVTDSEPEKKEGNMSAYEKIRRGEV